MAQIRKKNTPTLIYKERFLEQPTLWIHKSLKPFKAFSAKVYSRRKQTQARELNKKAQEKTLNLEQEQYDDTDLLLKNRKQFSIKSETQSVIRDTVDETQNQILQRSPLSSYETPLYQGQNLRQSLSNKIRKSINQQTAGSPGYRTLYSKHSLRTSSPTALRDLDEEQTLHRTPQMPQKTTLPNKFQLYQKFNSHALTPPFSEAGRHLSTRDMESLAEPLELISSTRSKVNFELLPSQNSQLRESPQFTPVQVKKSGISERVKSRRAYKHKLLLRTLKISIGYYAREMMGDRVSILDDKERKKNAFVGDLLLKWKYQNKSKPNRNQNQYTSQQPLIQSEQSFGSPQQGSHRLYSTRKGFQNNTEIQFIKSSSPGLQPQRAGPMSPPTSRILQREGVSPSENTNISNLSTPVSQTSTEYRTKLELNKKYLKERQQLLAKYERSKAAGKLGKRVEKRRGSFKETMRPLIKRK